jgi:hypothetical protein
MGSGLVQLELKEWSFARCQKETFGKMKEYYRGRSDDQNQAIPGELDAVGRAGGSPIYQERKSSTSRGRDVSVMDD